MLFGATLPLVTRMCLLGRVVRMGVDQPGGRAGCGFQQPQQQKNRPGHTAREEGPGKPWANLFPQEGALPAERRWQCGSCAGRRVRRPNQDRVDPAIRHRTSRRHDELGQWRAGSTNAAPMPLCWLDFTEYSFLGRKKGILILSDRPNGLRRFISSEGI